MAGHFLTRPNTKQLKPIHYSQLHHSKRLPNEKRFQGYCQSFFEKRCCVTTSSWESHNCLKYRRWRHEIEEATENPESIWCTHAENQIKQLKEHTTGAPQFKNVQFTYRPYIQISVWETNGMHVLASAGLLVSSSILISWPHFWFAKCSGYQ